MSDGLAAGWNGTGVPSNDLPAAFVAHPDVGEQNTVLDRSAEVRHPPLRFDGSDHDGLEDCGVLDGEVDADQLALLDSVEPFFARHGERAARARPDQLEL